LKFLILILIFLSCTPKEKAPQDSTKNPVYYRWDEGNLQESPLNIILAQEFLPLVAKEVGDTSGLNAVERMAQKWNEAHPSIDFYTLPFTVGGNKLYSNLDDYLNDEEIGIYFSDGWYRELSPSALAVTQFSGIRKFAGTPDEYLQLVHADILVNFRDFQYFVDSGPRTFDLLTVLIHEMGHLIGLPHVTNPNIESVMSPYLERGEKRRDLTPFDKATLLKYYPLIPPKKSAISSLLNIEAAETLEKHIIELESDGTCKHYLNGQYLFSH
jgi:hypothetical protein